MRLGYVIHPQCHYEKVFMLDGTQAFWMNTNTYGSTQKVNHVSYWNNVNIGYLIIICI